MRICRTDCRPCLRLLAAVACLIASGMSRVGQASETPASGHGEAAAEEAPVDPNSPIRGISLGEYHVRGYYPIEARRSTVIFALYAIVAKGNAEEFQHRLVNRRHKVRDQVIVSTRLAPLAEFDDAKLNEFRRRILVRLRRTLPDLAIDDVYIGNFSLEVRGI